MTSQDPPAKILVSSFQVISTPGCTQHVPQVTQRHFERWQGCFRTQFRDYKEVGCHAGPRADSPLVQGIVGAHLQRMSASAAQQSPSHRQRDESLARKSASPVLGLGLQRSSLRAAFSEASQLCLPVHVLAHTSLRHREDVIEEMREQARSRYLNDSLSNMTAREPRDRGHLGMPIITQTQRHR